MDAELRKKLSSSLGPGAIAKQGDVVAPADAAALAAAVRVCAEAKAQMTVRSRADADGSAPHDGVLLSLHRLNEVAASPAGLTLRAGAGATVAAVRAAAERSRLAVVGLGAAVTSEHVGGLIGRGEVPRRALCGVEAVLSGGDVVRFGAGVLKDVVGYDLPALLLGSLGRLAIVTAVSFRLEPVARGTPVPPAPGVAGDPGHALLARAFDPDGLLQPGP